MQFLTSILSLTTLLTLTTASAVPKATVLNPRQSYNNGSTTSANSTSEYYLKTSGASSASHNDLYIHSYHTGAGLNDVVGLTNLENASKGFLNETHAQFDFNTTFPWAFDFGGDTNYAGMFSIN